MKPNLHSLIQEYDQLFPVPHGGILQSLDELEQLVEEIGDRKFHSMAEIGSCFGGTVWLYSQLFGAEGCKFTIIDIEINPWLRKVIAEIQKRKNIDFNIMEIPSSRALLHQTDFLHIDADHRYHMVKADYERHSPMVGKGGIIVLHDTLLDEGPGDNKSGCIRFREELEHIYGHLGERDKIKTFAGTIMLCDCFGPNKSNPENRNIGITVIRK